MVIILDTYPTSCASKEPDKVPTFSDQCSTWIAACELRGHRILVTAIAYFEVLRELEMRTATMQIERLKNYCLRPSRFLSLATEDLELAASLWGQSRRAGKPTSDQKALDVDVISAAQALSLGLPATEYIIATTNPGHQSRFLPCDSWQNIRL